MTHLRFSLIGAVAAVATLVAGAASAQTYDFTLTDNNGVTIDASGVFNLTGDVINSISGQINGYGPITGLIPNPSSPGPVIEGNILYDNLFDPMAPGVDYYGIFVSTFSGVNINLYNTHSGGPNVPDNTATVYDDTINASVANGVFSVSGGVPEPAAWAMMLVGVGLAGAALRGAAKRTPSQA